jgi:hypothetical protein
MRDVFDLLGRTDIGKSLSHVSRCRALSHGPQYQVANRGVTVEARQATGVPIAVIDGPYDAAALFAILAQAPVDLMAADCRANLSTERAITVLLLWAYLVPAKMAMIPACALVASFCTFHCSSMIILRLRTSVNWRTRSGLR